MGRQITRRGVLNRPRTTKTIKTISCPSCDGVGKNEEDGNTCPDCKGKGQLENVTIREVRQ